MDLVGEKYVNFLFVRFNLWYNLENPACFCMQITMLVFWVFNANRLDFHLNNITEES